MTKTIIIQSVITAVLVVALMLGFSAVFPTAQTQFGGGTVENFPVIFSNGIRAGNSATYVVDSSANIVGAISSTKAITTTGALTVSGASVLSGAKTFSTATTTISSPAIISGAATLSGGATLSGTNTISGTANFTGLFSLLQSASTTIAVGNSSHTGCIALGDSSTSTVVYITATGATITATTTKPVACR